MLDQLPILINPTSFCDRGKQLVGHLKISELKRLSAGLFDSSGDVDVQLLFDKEGRVPTIQGVIKANLVLECQSCLDKVVYPIDRAVKLGIVLNMEQADRLASDCDPLILEAEKILLAELIEDELLLAVPDFPRHEHVCVEQDEVKSVVIIEDKQDLTKKDNPFSILATLKNTGE